MSQQTALVNYFLFAYKSILRREKKYIYSDPVICWCLYFERCCWSILYGYFVKVHVKMRSVICLQYIDTNNLNMKRIIVFIFFREKLSILVFVF